MQSMVIKDRAGLKRLLRGLAVAGKPDPGDESKVAAILEGVRQHGDRALLGYARRFDGLKLRSGSDLRIGQSAIRAAYAKVQPRFLRALKVVRANITDFQRKLRPVSWSRRFRAGVQLGQVVRPIGRVGLYVPAGEAPLISTVLMTAVPARVAGVAEIVLCSPNRGQGIDPRLLVAADLAGVTEIYQLGGAQAIAAMAYGTATLRQVDKIAGPGSRWVNLAKKQVYGTVGIDSLAGPSEAMLVADDSADPASVAADLLSQAEHAGDETAILVTTSKDLAAAVQRELALQLSRLPRRKFAESSFKRHGFIAVVKDLDAALEIVNALGPEHLQLMFKGAHRWVAKVRAAGAIFVGRHTPVALGDFLAGPSHVLPTGRAARFMSGLSVEDFVVKSSLIRYGAKALEQAGPVLDQMAGAEGLLGHARSASIRKKGAR